MDCETILAVLHFMAACIKTSCRLNSPIEAQHIESLTLTNMVKVLQIRKIAEMATPNNKVLSYLALETVYPSDM